MAEISWDEEAKITEKQVKDLKISKKNYEWDNIVTQNCGKMCCQKLR